MKGYGPPVCLIPLAGPDEFVRLPLKPNWVIDVKQARHRPGLQHGAPAVEIDGRAFRKSGKRTEGGWLIYRETRK